MNWPPGTDEAIIRDGCCLIGGSRKGLAPHHIKSEGSGGDDTLDNKITLCLEHHTQVHNDYLVLGNCVDIATARKTSLEVWTSRDIIDHHLRQYVEAANHAYFKIKELEDRALQGIALDSS